MSTDVTEKDFVASLARGLAVIRVFGRDAPSMTLTEVAKRAGMTRAAARRFLLTLAQLGYVATDGKHFQLTPRVMDLGFAYLSSMDLWQVAMPFMEQVSKELEESCSASVLDGSDVVYVARVPARRIMSVGLTVGTRLPAFCTSMGRVLLATKTPEEITAYISATDLKPFTDHTITDPDMLFNAIALAGQRGFALVDQELEEGLCSLAVPIRNKAGLVLAAMNVSGHASRVGRRDMEERFLPVLQDAAAEISRALP